MLRYVCLLAVLLIAGCEQYQVDESTLVYQEAKSLKQFELDDQFGQKVTNSDLKGQWTLLFLGYTSCPDICPMTLNKLVQLEQKMARKDLSVWFVSVDPARDTNAKRLAYINYFNGNFKAVTAEHKVLFPFVRNLHLVYAMTQGEADNYNVDHSASVALINPKGQLHAIFKPHFGKGIIPTIDVNKMKQDLNYILNHN